MTTRQKSFSPMAWHSKLSLNQKNVTYETVTVTFLDIPVLIRKVCLNVTPPTVPALKIADGEGPLDSPAIAEYVERNYPKGPSIVAQTASEKNLQLFLDSYMCENHIAENAAYFKSSREKGGKTLERCSGDQAQSLKELKDTLELIHMALLRWMG
ncbi:hypothetical protein BGX30_004217 [Mortierella sp. GBA39]|nr:hypothetical protein BGX30_004217 [Mortierella sp. GBA39]